MRRQRLSAVQPRALTSNRRLPATIGAGRVIALSALAALVLFVAGCSSSKHSATPAKAHSPISSTSIGTVTSTTLVSGISGGSVTTLAPGTPASVPAETAPPSGVNQSFCDSVVQGQQQLGDLDPNTTPPAQFLAAAKQVFAKATTTSPTDLKPDMTIVNDYVQSQTSIDGLGGALPASVAPATTRVQAWFLKNCKLDLRIG